MSRNDVFETNKNPSPMSTSPLPTQDGNIRFQEASSSTPTRSASNVEQITLSQTREYSHPESLQPGFRTALLSAAHEELQGFSRGSEIVGTEPDILGQHALSRPADEMSPTNPAFLNVIQRAFLDTWHSIRTYRRNQARFSSVKSTEKELSWDGESPPATIASVFEEMIIEKTSISAARDVSRLVSGKQVPSRSTAVEVEMKKKKVPGAGFGVQPRAKGSKKGSKDYVVDMIEEAKENRNVSYSSNRTALSQPIASDEHSKNSSLPKTTAVFVSNQTALPKATNITRNSSPPTKLNGTSPAFRASNVSQARLRNNQVMVKSSDFGGFLSDAHQTMGGGGDRQFGNSFAEPSAASSQSSVSKADTDGQVSVGDNQGPGYNVESRNRGMRADSDVRDGYVTVDASHMLRGGERRTASSGDKSSALERGGVRDEAGSGTSNVDAARGEGGVNVASVEGAPVYDGASLITTEALESALHQYDASQNANSQAYPPASTDSALGTRDDSSAGERGNRDEVETSHLADGFGGMSAGAEMNTGAGSGTDFGTGVETKTASQRSGSRIGKDTSVGSGVGSGMGSGIGSGVGSGTGSGIDSRTGSDLGRSSDMGTGIGTGTDSGLRSSSSSSAISSEMQGQNLFGENEDAVGRGSQQLDSVAGAGSMMDGNADTPRDSNMNDVFLTSSDEEEKKKLMKFQGVPNGLVQGENVTQLSLMVYKIAKKENVEVMAAAPCREVMHWMPSVVRRLQMEIEGFTFFCVDTSEDSKGMGDLKEAYGSMPAKYIRAPVEEVGEQIPNRVDLVVSWMGVQGWGIRRSWKFIKSLRRNGVRMCLLSNNPIRNNVDEKSGQLNVRKAPMLFNEPMRVIGKVSEDNSKQMLLYSMDNVRDDF